MKLVPALLLITLLTACASTDSTPRGRAYGVIFEYVASPRGTLEKFQLARITDGERRHPELEIADAWLKTACVMTVLDGLEPTYSEGELPVSRWIYFIYQTDRPDRVYRNRSSGLSIDNPSVFVRPEILEESGNEDDGSTVCDAELRPPAE